MQFCSKLAQNFKNLYLQNSSSLEAEIFRFFLLQECYWIKFNGPEKVIIKFWGRKMTIAIKFEKN